LYLERSEIAERLLSQLKKDVFSGRSTPGRKSENDLQDIVLWKSKKAGQKRGGRASAQP
jgi:hypothetical protein